MTNDQAGVLAAATTSGAMTYIDSPVDYNDFNSASWWRKFPNGTHYTETLNKEDPVFGTTYQTAQIGNRTLRWLDGILGSETVASRPFFVYLGPHAPHYPAEPAPWYVDAFPGATAPRTPNYNTSSPNKTRHIRQNPPLDPAIACWSDQLFRDRWRSLLSIDDLIDSMVARLEAAGVMNRTYWIYSSGGSRIQ